jgi:hypothetical protein
MVALHSPSEEYESETRELCRGRQEERMAAGLPDPHVLDAEANVLRPQAAALHQAAVDALRRDIAMGKEWDRTRGPELEAARKGVEEAQGRVKQQTEGLEVTKTMLKAAEEDAKDTTNLSKAEEGAERASRLRVVLEEEQKELDSTRMDVIAHEGRASQLQAERESTVRTSNTIEKAADHIDDKIRLLSEGAQKQREADTQRDNGDLTGAAESERAARYFIDQADKLTIDVSKVSPAILDEAGIDPATLNRAPQESAVGSVDESGTQQFAGMPSSVDPAHGEEPDAEAAGDPATGISTAAAQAGASAGGEVGDDVAGSPDAQATGTTPQPVAAGAASADDSGDAFGSTGDPVGASASAGSEATMSSLSDTPESPAVASYDDDSSFNSRSDYTDVSSGDAGSGDMELDPNEV